MNCPEAKDHFAAYLADDIDDASREAVRDHIAACPSCREELEGLSAVWTALGVLPREEPSGRLREGFYTMLREAKAAEARRERKKALRPRGLFEALGTGRLPAFGYSLVAILLVVGAAGGYALRSARVSAQTSALRREVQDMRRDVALAKIDRPQASERLEALSLSARLDNPDRATLRALLNTLDGDPNVNVRLAAVDALYLFRNDPAVRDGLVAALGRQFSPLVQVALIDLLVEVRERRAVDALRRLIGTGRLAAQVRDHAELGLKQIL